MSGATVMLFIVEHLSQMCPDMLCVGIFPTLAIPSATHSFLCNVVLPQYEIPCHFLYYNSLVL